MKNKKRARPPEPTQGKHFGVAKFSKAESSNTQKPRFSLEHLRKAYCLSHCTKDEKVAFANRLLELSQLTWAQLNIADRHKMGYETISRDAIRDGIPSVLTDDERLIAFRFNGLAPMVGFRREATFYVVWFDRGFTLYAHG